MIMLAHKLFPLTNKIVDFPPLFPSHRNYMFRWSGVLLMFVGEQIYLSLA